MTSKNAKQTARPTRPKTQRSRFAPAGAWTAVALLVLAGVAYRVAAARLGNLSGAVVLVRGTLNNLPMQIGDWKGHDVELDERIVRATDTDDHVSRTYRQTGRTGEASLFIGFGVRFRDLLPHRPEVCYRGAGWTLEGTHEPDLTANDGSPLLSTVYHFGRGGLASEQITVLNYYIVDGQYCKDVSRLRSEVWKLRSDVRYVAQIQIAAADAGRRDSGGETTAEAFAAESAQAILETIERAVEEASATADGAVASPS